MDIQEQEERIGRLLICRNYLYALFRLVFGSAPRAETMTLLFSPETRDCLQALRDAYRENGLAAKVSRVVAEDKRSLPECVDEMLACIAAQTEICEEEEFISALTSDYMTLFQAPGDRYVHLWESPYIHRDNMLFQQSTLDVRNYYHAAGFKLQAEQRYPDDHIAAMMGFMARCGLDIVDALEKQDMQGAIDKLTLSRAFAAKHLKNWIDDFASDVIKKDTRAIYAACASGMVAFIHADLVLTEAALATLKVDDAMDEGFTAERTTLAENV